MAIVYIREFDTGADRTTSNYDEIGRRMRLGDDPPEGLIVHTAGFSGGRFRMFEVWESAGHEERFERDRLMPAVLQVAGDHAAAPRTETYELHALLAPGLVHSS